MKLLLLDIETAPNTAYVWGLFKENIPLARLIDSGHVLSWAAKWYGEEEVRFDSINKSGKKKMIENIHQLVDEAEVVIHYYGSRFDMPTLNKEFVLAGKLPPSPYKQIDLLKVVRKHFRFVSNKLEFVAKALGVKQKVKHAGFEMWIKCMANDPQAWKEMEEYNVGDVLVLEQVYERLLPWINNHPNVGQHNNMNDVCPNCGGHHLEKRGFTFTAAGKYQRYQCKECGTWSRSKQNVAIKNAIVQDRN